MRVGAIAIGTALLSFVVPSIRAAEPAEALIFLDAPPARMMVGEPYAFYARVENRSGRDIPLAVELTVRDGSIELNDVGVARDPSEGASIARRPQAPRTATDAFSESTAICEWGRLAPGRTARCAFYVFANGATLGKIPFAIEARDAGSGTTLASHVFAYRVEPGVYVTKSLRDYDHRLRAGCADLGNDGAWTPAYGECYEKQKKTMGPPAFPIPGLIAEPRQPDPPVR